MLEEKTIAPVVKELARALGEGADEERIRELLRDFLENMKLEMDQAKRMVIKVMGGRPMASPAAGQDRKLDGLALDEKSVNLVVRVVHVTEKEIEAQGTKKRIYSGILGDETTTRPFTAWDAGAFKLSKGDVIKIENAYTTEWKGEPQVNLGRGARIAALPQSALPKVGRRSEMRKIAELQDGMSGVGLSGRILGIERREVTVGEEKKTVFSGTLADQTGKTMFSSWHDFGLKEGDAIRVSGGYTKSWRGILQFNFDDRSQLEKLDDFPAAKDLSKPVMHNIESLDRVASAVDIEVRGIVLDIRPGSGLIFRCPQCNRVLQAQSCREHGDVEGEPDLRVKAILDDGTGAMTVVCGRDVTEKLLGKNLDAVLKEIHGKKVVNYDTVRDRVAEMLVAKPVMVRGNATNDEFGLMLVSTELRFLSMGVADDARAMLAEEEGAQ